MHSRSDEFIAFLRAGWRDELAAGEIVPVEGGMSDAGVFRASANGRADRYLKIAIGDMADDLRREIERTKWLASQGVRVPHILKELETKTGAAVLMTAISGTHLDGSRPDLFEAARAVGRGLARLHSLPVENCPFDEAVPVRLDRARDIVRRGLVDPGRFDARNIGLSPDQLLQRLAAGIPACEETVVVHGDATLSNILVEADGSIGFIDCGHCGRSDRYVDLAVLAGTLHEELGEEAAEIMIGSYGIQDWDGAKASFFLDLYELF